MIPLVFTIRDSLFFQIFVSPTLIPVLINFSKMVLLKTLIQSLVFKKVFVKLKIQFIITFILPNPRRLLTLVVP